jgi:hypothetical protein
LQEQSNYKSNGEGQNVKGKTMTHLQLSPVCFLEVISSGADYIADVISDLHVTKS